MEWKKRGENNWIKFGDLTKRSYIGARIDFVNNQWKAVVYVTNYNQSNILVLEESMFGTLSSANSFCNRNLRVMIVNIKDLIYTEEE